MANMQVTDRNQYERLELEVPDTGVAVKSRKTLPILMVLLLALLAVLIYGMVDGWRGWAHGVVLGGIVTTVIGTMLAVSPNRKA